MILIVIVVVNPSNNFPGKAHSMAYRVLKEAWSYIIYRFTHFFPPTFSPYLIFKKDYLIGHFKNSYIRWRIEPSCL